jgi:hypothetical protein
VKQTLFKHTRFNALKLVDYVVCSRDLDIPQSTLTSVEKQESAIVLTREVNVSALSR